MRKENIKLSIIISLLIVASLSTTYAFLELGDTNSSATGEAGCFNVDYSANAIDNGTLDTALGSSLNTISTTVTLSKNENCKIYTKAEINLNASITLSQVQTNLGITLAKALATNALNYQINVKSGDGRILNEDETTTTEKTAVINNIGADINLANVTLTENSTTYTITLWIDPELSQGYFDDAIFDGYIYAESSQTSTIK